MIKVNDENYVERYNELVRKYSRTAQALKEEEAKPGSFGSVLEAETEPERAPVRYPSAASDSSAWSMIARLKMPAGPDTLIAQAADRYAQALNLMGRRDYAVSASESQYPARPDIVVSRFARALSEGYSGKRDTLIAEAAEKYSEARDISGHIDEAITTPDAVFAQDAESYSRAVRGSRGRNNTAHAPESVIAQAAEKYAQAMGSIMDYYDPVLSASARNGELA